MTDSEKQIIDAVAPFRLALNRLATGQEPSDAETAAAIDGALSLAMIATNALTRIATVMETMIADEQADRG